MEVFKKADDKGLPELIFPLIISDIISRTRMGQIKGSSLCTGRFLCYIYSFFNIIKITPLVPDLQTLCNLIFKSTLLSCTSPKRLGKYLILINKFNREKRKKK